MSHDEIQKLMSAYATGSLSESERRLLYEAALEDQDLFDQLSREHALKQLIETPGVKDRLIASLEPAQAGGATARGWLKPLSWGLAMAFVVGVSLTAVFIAKSSLQKANESTQAAQVAQAIAPATPPDGSAVERSKPDSAPPPPSARREARPELRDEKTAKGPVTREANTREANTRETKKKEADAAAAPLAKSEDKDGRLDGTRASTPPPVSAPAAAAPPPPTNAVTGAQIAGQLAPPVQVQPQGFAESRNQAPSQQDQQQPQSKNDQNRPGQSADIAGGVAGGGGGAAGGRARSISSLSQPASAPASAPAPASKQAAKDASTRFGFDYSLEGLDLVFKFYADGYFSLHIAPGGLTIVDSRVTAGTTRRERIQNNGTEADIVFSVRPQMSTGGVKLSSDTRSGSAEDPARTRIELLVRFFPPPF